MGGWQFVNKLCGHSWSLSAAMFNLKDKAFYEMVCIIAVARRWVALIILKYSPRQIPFGLTYLLPKKILLHNFVIWQFHH